LGTKKIYDITIVGGGIVGTATAYKIQIRHPALKILVIEKEEKLAYHQTGNNSGVIHSGLYYKPGSYKAKNCVDGRKQLVKFAQEHNIKHDVCGKVVVAVEKSEIPIMDKIFDNGIANDTEALQTAINFASQRSYNNPKIRIYSSVVHLPSKQFLVDSLLLLSGVILEGAGQFSTAIVHSGRSTKCIYTNKDTHNR